MSEKEVPQRAARPASASADAGDPYVQSAIGPVLAGMILDGIDFASPGVLGLFLGVPLGGLAAGWLARHLGYSRRGQLVAAVVGAVYCAFPPTSFLPLATMMGLLGRARSPKH